MNSYSQPTSSSKSLFHGIYTLPDAAHILNVPLAKLRRWADTDAPGPLGAVAEDATAYGLSNSGIQGEAREKQLDFLTLIELFTIYQLREPA